MWDSTFQKRATVHQDNTKKFFLYLRSLFGFFTWETELGLSCKQYHFLRLKNFKFLIRTMNLVDGPTKNFIEYYITS